MTHYKKIIVPLDGSGWAEQAVVHAKRIARNNDAEMILLHVYRSPLSEYRDQIALAKQNDLVDQEREQIKNHLISVRNDLRGEGIKVRGHLLDGRNPAHHIIQYAKNEEADLIVMSTHGRTGLARFLFGSVARKVMEGLDIPVMLVRPDKNDPAREDPGDLEANIEEI